MAMVNIRWVLNWQKKYRQWNDRVKRQWNDRVKRKKKETQHHHGADHGTGK